MRAVIAVPFSNYTSVQKKKMLKVTSMLFCLTSPWEGPENCSQCFFLQTYYFGSRRIYCDAHECETEASWCCTNSRNSIRRKYTTVYRQSGFIGDLIPDCNTDTDFFFFLGPFLLINVSGSGKKRKWIQCAHLRVLNPIKDFNGFFPSTLCPVKHALPT